MNDSLDSPNTNDPTSAHPPALSASESIVIAIADAEDVSPLDLPPLYSTIDPDALDAFIGSLNGTPDEREGSATFAYGNYEVTVTEGGGVSLAESGR